MLARKRQDGRYNLIPWGVKDKMVLRGLVTRGLATYDPDSGKWTASAETVTLARIEKVFGVMTGPPSCGCEPAGFRWVTESEVKAGRTDRFWCPGCSDREAGMFISRDRDIIDVCGEADVAEAVYEAEFRDKVESLA